MGKNGYSNRMSEVFKGFRYYTDDEYKEIWRNSIIVLDSCALLNLYRYPNDVSESMLKVLAKFKDKIWLPYQVGYEYMKNKDKTKSNFKRGYSSVFEELEKAKMDVEEEFSKHEINKNDDIARKVIEAQKDYYRELDKISKQVEKTKNVDDIEKRIYDLLDDKMGKDFTSEERELEKIEGIRRFKETIPPGYKDDKKPENGDYYVYKMIVKQAKDVDKNVIFITDDMSDNDWFHKENGEKKGGNKSLLNEFYNLTGKMLCIYTTTGFLKNCSKYTNTEVAKEVVTEISRINKYNKERNIIMHSHHYFSPAFRPWDIDMIFRRLSIYLYKGVECEELKNAIENILLTLTQREETVIRLVYGFDGTGRVPIEIVAQRMDISREDVFNILKHAKMKLTHPNRIREVYRAMTLLESPDNKKREDYNLEDINFTDYIASA